MSARPRAGIVVGIAVTTLLACTPAPGRQASTCTVEGATEPCVCGPGAGGTRACEASGLWSECSCVGIVGRDAGFAPLDGPDPASVTDTDQPVPDVAAAPAGGDVNAEPCVPYCAGKQCGDDGCGDAAGCGTCPGGAACVDHVCQGECTPSCAGKQCGDDGCGNAQGCGTCPGGAACTGNVCQGMCTPSCAGKQCGDDGCGDAQGCGTCPAGAACVGNVCQGACTPTCAGKQCGDDGCGNANGCGACPGGAACVNNSCQGGECQPTCSGKQCGDDGCGNPTGCGTCPNGASCDNANQCVGGTGPGPGSDACGLCAPGTSCGADPNAPAWCAGNNCNGVSFQGGCLGDLVVFCDGGVLYSIDCLFLGGGQSICGFNPEAGYYDCLGL